MRTRVAFTAALLMATVPGCTDRFRNPCEAAATTTTTIVRTKNKALGWIPPSTIFYDIHPRSGPRLIEKCA